VIEPHRNPALALGRLSRSEREVLELLAAGMRAREVAEATFRSLPTIRTHIRSILMKLDVSSQLEAVALMTHHSVTDTARDAIAGELTELAAHLDAERRRALDEEPDTPARRQKIQHLVARRRGVTQAHDQLAGAFLATPRPRAVPTEEEPAS
jgi:DNA-binding CsgD family transcriptional regulator